MALPAFALSVVTRLAPRIARTIATRRGVDYFTTQIIRAVQRETTARFKVTDLARVIRSFGIPTTNKFVAQTSRALRLYDKLGGEQVGRRPDRPLPFTAVPRNIQSQAREYQHIFEVKFKHAETGETFTAFRKFETDLSRSAEDAANEFARYFGDQYRADGFEIEDLIQVRQFRRNPNLP